jgi:hypothetical protein
MNFSDFLYSNCCLSFSGSRCSGCRLDRCLVLGMNFAKVKLPDGVDPRTVEALMASRRRYLTTTGFRLEENRGAESSMCIAALTSLPEEMLEHTELTRLVYIEERANRIRLSIDGIELESRLRELSLHQIIDTPNNVLNHSEAFAVLFLRFFYGFLRYYFFFGFFRRKKTFFL